MDNRLRHYRSSYDLRQCGSIEQGRFRSRWYPGLSRRMQWLRLTVQGTVPMHVRVYVCDHPPEDFREVEDTPVLERIANDLLLYEARGKYLAFTVEPGEALRSFVLSFPGRSIAEGLPLILQGDDTLRALLAVCQSEYLDITAEIHTFPTRLNPAHPDALQQLPQWIGAQKWISDHSTAKKILPQAPLLARLRGTRRGLQLLTRLVTDYPCRIMEANSGAKTGRNVSQWDEYRHSSVQPDTAISILVPSCAARKDVQCLRLLLPDFIPMGVSYTLIHLEDSAPMDEHCYLDENASLMEPPACELDGAKVDEVILE